MGGVHCMGGGHTAVHDESAAEVNDTSPPLGMAQRADVILREVNLLPPGQVGWIQRMYLWVGSNGYMCGWNAKSAEGDQC
jgi:hypothetical protein